MLELLDALPEARGAIEQELWSFRGCAKCRTGKAENQQKKCRRDCCATAGWAAGVYVWGVFEGNAPLPNPRRTETEWKAQEWQSASPPWISAAFLIPSE